MGEEEAGDSYHDDDRDPWSSSLPVVVCKGKRSKRQRVHAAPPPPAEVVVIVAASAEAESSSADAGWRSGAEEDEEDMALCLMLLARGRGGPSFVAPDAAAAESTAAKEGKFRSRRPADGGGAGEFVYECRTCGRCFPSFQALGGHRTSHKKPRLLLLSDEKKRQPAVDEERRTPSLSPSPPSPAPHATADPTVLATPPKHEASMATIDVSRRQQGRVHECSICGAEFASGQALGGHMRRHRPLVVPASAASSSDDLAAIRIIKEKSLLELDLNKPAPCDDDAAETTSPVAPKHVGAGGGLPLLASKANQSGNRQ